ncbi:hypothetical protein KNP414_07828 [Paenibacillus mucilaginosus KNP414]|uniref:Uncharacterized protein n=1 Tax=Paenibacillus mucilaginosus (strain KNP414) TaxID=1036673 RepID=F8FIT6_PAEMK|nr:hypothetical protein KNP414_07828 [Paenibacillus mucilaginosus KNP414]
MMIRTIIIIIRFDYSTAGDEFKRSVQKIGAARPRITYKQLKDGTGDRRNRVPG